MTVVLHPATPTDGTVEQKKVSSRNWLNAKPTWTVYIVLLFLLSTVSSNPIHARTTSPPSTSAHPHTPHGGDIGSGGQCALCLDPECATHIVRICNGDDLFIWKNGMLGIENCCKDNLKPDEPCQLTNGSLVVQSDQPLSFEGNDSLSGGMKAFPTETVCKSSQRVAGSIPPGFVEVSLNKTPNPQTLPTSWLPALVLTCLLDPSLSPVVLQLLGAFSEVLPSVSLSLSWYGSMGKKDGTGQVLRTLRLLMGTPRTRTR
ncbi:uncharacterized protein LOC133140229 isoform X2 [Conger conger]|uniref:uncharacterized protein LOC133140229 isoform X2 n=1 Tax=Conger conger TaxID=82655 RepID=UPI002A5AE230|nr:uncharacterized protein LOC133140229 isoform X2 [Conger conger]